MGHLLKKEEEKINEVRYDHKISHTKTGDVHFFYSYNDIADGDIEFEYDYDQNGNQLRYFQVYKDGKLLLIENKFNKNNQLIESTNYNYSQYRKSVTIKTAKLITADREVKTYDKAGNLLTNSTYKNEHLASIEKLYYKKF
jgi:antitoxin component YwqK of YwqJK toxin-antitoxin module